MSRDYPHFMHRCGPCKLMVSQTNSCPGPATCLNIRRDDSGQKQEVSDAVQDRASH